MTEAKKLIEEKRLEATNKLLLSYNENENENENENLNTDDLLKEVLLLNDVLKNTKLINKVDQLIKEKEEYLVNAENIQNYIESEKIYYEYVNKVQRYPFNQEKEKIYKRYLIEQEDNSMDFMRKFTRINIIREDLIEHLFMYALRLYFNNRIKKSETLLELIRIGVTSVSDLTNDDVYSYMMDNLELNIAQREILKKITNFKYDAFGTNHNLEKEKEMIELLDGKIEKAIYSRKSICTY